MPVMSTDLAVGWSTQFQTLFQTQYNQSIAVQEAAMAPVIMGMDLGNFQGNKVTLDWLGASPQMRQWVDEKRAIGLNRYTQDVVVARYEATVEIDLDALRDGRGNIYEPRIREIAQNGSRLPYNLVSDLIIGGKTVTCYDGQYFYDTDHSEGDSGTQSNLLTGSGADTVAHITTDYYAAKTALMGYKDDKGVALHPYDFRPLLWLPNDKTVIQNIETLHSASMISQTTNVLMGKFDYIVDPRLTDTNDWQMFRPDTVMKAFFRVNREPVHYEDNFGTGHPDVWSRRIGQAGAVGRMAATYGMWQTAVRISN